MAAIAFLDRSVAGSVTVRRRFYRQASAARLETGWTILLDRRPARTPAGKALQVATQALAEAVAEEWNDQEREIRPDAMPLTRLAMNANDRIPAHRDQICQEVVRYVQSDLVCYRASEPEALAERQWRLWQPLVDWLALDFDAPLTVTQGVMPIAQPPEALLALARAVKALDDFRLTALAMATGATGSLVVALALLHGRLDGDGAFELCQLDETYQIERWGEDAQAADQRAALRADLGAIARFFALLSAE